MVEEDKFFAVINNFCNSLYVEKAKFG